MEVRDDDIWISSLPKCGTTWTQEMVWNIWNNLNLDFAKKVSLDKRIPFLEMTALWDRKLFAKFSEEEKKSNPSIYDSVNFVKNLPKEQNCHHRIFWNNLDQKG